MITSGRKSLLKSDSWSMSDQESQSNNIVNIEFPRNDAEADHIEPSHFADGRIKAQIMAKRAE